MQQPPSANTTPVKSPPGTAGTSGNIQVACRFRPQNKLEISKGSSLCVSFPPDGRSVKAVENTGTDYSFAFDRVFDMNSTQREVYEVVGAPVVDAIFEGYNATIFAYGQTGAGKTFTMMGPADKIQGYCDDPEKKGLIPRIAEAIFHAVESADEHIEFLIKVSYVEIYMEKIKDLLRPEKNNLQIHEEKNGRGVFIQDVTEVYVSSVAELFQLMAQGATNRVVASTNMNAESSRSHSIFIVNLALKDTRSLESKTSKLFLVDLAGSEKVGKTGASGQTLDEAKTINKSLSALGNVINSLTDGKSSHVPYRDSKLTRLLQDSLGGNSRTTLCINCSPSTYNDAETVSTMRFGQRAKNIKNKARINKQRTVEELQKLLDEAEDQIERLKAQLAAVSANAGTAGADPEAVNKLVEMEMERYVNEMQELREKIEGKDDEVSMLKQFAAEFKAESDKLRRENEILLHRLADSTMEVDTKQQELEEIKVEKDAFFSNLQNTQEENRKLQDDLIELRRKLQNLEDSASEQRQSVATAAAAAAAAAAAVASAERQQSQHEQTAQAAVGEMATRLSLAHSEELTRRDEHHRQEIEHLRKASESVRDELQWKYDKLDANFKNRTAALERQLQEKDELLEKSSAHNKSLELKIDALEKDLSRTRMQSEATAAATGASNARLSSEMETVLSEREHLRQSLRRTQEEMGGLELELDHRKCELTKVYADLEGFQQQYAKDVGKLIEQKVVLEQRLDIMADEQRMQSGKGPDPRQMKRRIDQLESVVSTMQREHQQIVQQNHNLKMEVDIAMRKLENSKLKNDALEATNKKLKEEFFKMDDELRRYKQQQQQQLQQQAQQQQYAGVLGNPSAAGGYGSLAASQLAMGDSHPQHAHIIKGVRGGGGRKGSNGPSAPPVIPAPPVFASPAASAAGALLEEHPSAAVHDGAEDFASAVSPPPPPPSSSSSSSASDLSYVSVSNSNLSGGNAGSGSGGAAAVVAKKRSWFSRTFSRADDLEPISSSDSPHVQSGVAVTSPPLVSTSAVAPANGLDVPAEGKATEHAPVQRRRISFLGGGH